jgi:hypothetical protein
MEMREMAPEEAAKVAKAGRTLTTVGCICEAFASPFVIAIVRGFTLGRPGTIATGFVFFLFFSGIAGVIVYFGSRFANDAREAMAAVERGANQIEKHTWIDPHLKNGPQIPYQRQVVQRDLGHVRIRVEGWRIRGAYAPRRDLSSKSGIRTELRLKLLESR